MQDSSRSAARPSRGQHRVHGDAAVRRDRPRDRRQRARCRRATRAIRGSPSTSATPTTSRSHARTPRYARLLAAADVVFSDGVPITWVGRRAYPAEGTAWERVYGPDVMRGVLDRSTADGPTHYLLGSTPETLDALRAQIAVDHPQAIVVGAESPPFRTATPDELAERDERIRDSGASIVWVGLGTPKQDTEVQRLAGEPARPRHGRGGGVRLPRGHQAAGAGVDAAQRPGVGVPARQRAGTARQALRLGQLRLRPRGGPHDAGHPPQRR